jgi:hypothetical protein
MQLRKEYNEYWILVTLTIMTLIYIVLAMVFFLAKLYKIVVFRILLVCFNAFVVNFVFWLRNYEVLFHIFICDFNWLDTWMERYVQYTMRIFEEQKKDRPTSVGPEQIREMITKKLGFLSGTCAAPVIPQKHKYSLDEELELEENQVEKKESPPPEPTVASNATVFPPPKEKEDEPSLAI